MVCFASDANYSNSNSYRNSHKNKNKKKNKNNITDIKKRCRAAQG